MLALRRAAAASDSSLEGLATAFCSTSSHFPSSLKVTQQLCGGRLLRLVRCRALRDYGGATEANVPCVDLSFLSSFWRTCHLKSRQALITLYLANEDERALLNWTGENWRGFWRKGDVLLQHMSDRVRSGTSGEAASLKNAAQQAVTCLPWRRRCFSGSITEANVVALWIKTPTITFNSQAGGQVLLIPDEQPRRRASNFKQLCPQLFTSQPL